MKPSLAGIQPNKRCLEILKSVRSQNQSFCVSVELRRGLGWIGFRPVGRKFEADQPFAWDAVAIIFRRSEFPLLRGLQGLLSKIFAGTRGFQVGVRNSASGIDVSANGDANGAVNGVECLL